MKSNLQKYFSKIGKKGGENRMASMTPEAMREFVMKGVAARKRNKELRKISIDKAAL